MTASGQSRPEAKAAVSAELASIIMKRQIGLGFSHPITERWSAEGRMALQIPEKGGKTAEEEEHDSSLSAEDSSGKMMRLRPQIMLGTRFWPCGFMEGAYLGLYGVHSVGAGIDITAGCGYTAGIWKGLKISAGYEMKLDKNAVERDFNADGITISINYIF